MKRPVFKNVLVLVEISGQISPFLFNFFSKEFNIKKKSFISAVQEEQIRKLIVQRNFSNEGKSIVSVLEQKIITNLYTKYLIIIENKRKTSTIINQDYSKSSLYFRPMGSQSLKPN